MALKITDECISCAACVADCPNEAISEGPEYYVIDPTKCLECAGDFEGPQCVSVCPVDCIVPDPEHQETREELLAKRQRKAASTS